LQILPSHYWVTVLIVIFTDLLKKKKQQNKFA
jgi:hypothetical protein